MQRQSAWRRRAIGGFIIAVLTVQVGFAINGYRDPHKFFAFQPFNESSTWQAEIVRVTDDGRRIPISEPCDGYTWSQLVRVRGLSRPSVRHHADAGLSNQVAFLDAALDYVAGHTPRDIETRYLEAIVTTWHNTDEPTTVVLRSRDRDT